MTVLGGAVLGGILGSLSHKGLGMSKESLAGIDGNLSGGKAAVAVLANPDQAELISAKLAELGGVPESHDVSDEVVEQAVAAAEQAPVDEPADSSRGSAS